MKAEESSKDRDPGAECRSECLPECLGWRDAPCLGLDRYKALIVETVDHMTLVRGHLGMPREVLQNKRSEFLRRRLGDSVGGVQK